MARLVGQEIRWPFDRIFLIHNFGLTGRVTGPWLGDRVEELEHHQRRLISESQKVHKLSVHFVRVCPSDAVRPTLHDHKMASLDGLVRTDSGGSNRKDAICISVHDESWHADSMRSLRKSVPHASTQSRVPFAEAAVAMFQLL